MIQRIQTKRNENGFTLIELLIVIIVLGILAAIVVFAVGSTKKDSVAATCKTDFKAMELSAEAANTKTGSYPTVPGELLNSAGKGGLLKNLPTSTDYTLTYSSASPSTYSIAIGGSGVVGGSNDPAVGCVGK
jgi:general secretion pathway protein G